MKTILTTFAFLSLFLFSNQLSFAQEPQIINIGDEISDTFEMRTDEMLYSFEGTAGTIVVVEVLSEDILSGFFPEVTLVNDRGSTLASSGDFSNSDNFEFAIDKATIFLDLPRDGVYTVVISLNQFATLQSDAPFVLRVISPEILEVSQSIESELTTSRDTYFVVISEDIFTINYRPIRSNFATDLIIYRLDSDTRETLGTISGKDVVSASLTVAPNRNMIHIVEVTQSALDFTGMFNEESATFEITYSTE